MKIFNVSFLKESKKNNSFIEDTVDFLTTAEVSKSEKNHIELFHIKLNDIGLDSLFGEFDILRKNGLWRTNDQDDKELYSLKRKITEAIDELPE